MLISSHTYTSFQFNIIFYNQKKLKIKFRYAKLFNKKYFYTENDNNKKEMLSAP